MSLTKRTITFLGGDRRSVYLAEMFKQDSYDVTTFGFDEEIRDCKRAENLQAAMEDAPILIGPLPFANKVGHLNAPLCNEKIPIDRIINEMKNDQILFGGHIEKKWMEKASKANVQIVDYFHDEALQVKNAIPTAEGTIQLVMEKLPTTIHGANVIVLGFGRIGKVLAHLFQQMGANVAVGARKSAHFAWITQAGYRPVHLSEMATIFQEMDVIVNTIPVQIVGMSQLVNIRKDALLIDVASHPGGIDLEAAKALQVTPLQALGLPGKVAPKSAAKYMKETIEKAMKKLEG
ncbi:dipicolinate synthase subunit DpsA [Pseudogracilibacillus sp. ICA-222130]|uniref:dipicolinate synthase subunit DpsA n=1 Tax=Pseudogracilibacillus sp. ICA-222130 TaxID=3134655 RepID=UPI0030BB3472